MSTSDRRPRVLVVEGCPNTAELLRAFLARRGFEVRVARDEAAGYITAIWFRPGAVVIELGLSGPVGLRLPNLLRRLPAADAPRVVAATAPDSPTARLAARIAGFEYFLPRPFDWDRVAALLEGRPAISA
jgi:DNA-binding response OmpR family regulator